VVSGQEVYTFDQASAVLVFSPDGRTLVTGGGGSEDEELRLWDVTRGKLLHGLRKAGPAWASAVAFTPDGKRLVTAGGDPPPVFRDVADKLAPAWEPRDLAPEELERLWNTLGSGNAKDARKALWKLVASPKQSVPLLRERLQPIPRADAKRIQALLADLGSPTHQVREEAFTALEMLGPAAETALQEALVNPPSLEVKERLQRLLKALEPAGSTPRKLRNLRAIEALEHIGTPQARAALQAMSLGAPGAPETEDAILALERLRRRSTASP
jgi:hypothetical protein